MSLNNFLYVISDVNGIYTWMPTTAADVEVTEWPQHISTYDNVLDVIILYKLLSNILSNVQGRTF
jgi:hypothetical protein